MRKAIILFLLFCITLCFCACGNQASNPADKKLLDEKSIFSDSIFEQSVRSYLNITEKEIDTENLKNVTELDLSYTGHGTFLDDKITSLVGLKYFPSLKKLTLNGNAFAQLTGIELCTQLEELNAEYCRIYNAEAITSIKTLKVLDLRGNFIKNLTFLTSMPQLTDINVSKNAVSDLSFFTAKGFSNLKRLAVGGNATTDVFSVYKLTTLEYLDISELSVEDIRGIQNLTQLKEFKASGNQITSIEPLSKLTNLESVDLNTNNISDFSALLNSPNLIKINLSKNKITSIEALSNLKNLTYIDFSDNKIVNYEVLNGRTIETVKFDGNSVKYTPN